MPRGSTRAATHNRILEKPAMAKARSLVSLDVHATKIVAAVLDAETGQLQTCQMTEETEKTAEFCAALPRPVRAAYEAGPTGYGLARELARRGVACMVAAPSKIPRAAGDRVKTDRHDAEHLVRLLWAGKLHPVRVPRAEEMTATPGLTGTASGLRRSSWTGRGADHLAGRSGRDRDARVAGALRAGCRPPPRWGTSRHSLAGCVTLGATTASSAGELRRAGGFRRIPARRAPTWRTG